MNSQHVNQDDAGRGSVSAQDPAENGRAAEESAGEAESCGDRRATAQAVRAVMHPERHEPEWRYVYGALPGQ
jgi:hypothetical protein